MIFPFEQERVFNISETFRIYKNVFIFDYET